MRKEGREDVQGGQGRCRKMCKEGREDVGRCARRAGKMGKEGREDGQGGQGQGLPLAGSFTPGWGS